MSGRACEGSAGRRGCGRPSDDRLSGRRARAAAPGRAFAGRRERPAQEAQAKADAERRARQLTAALAATILLFVALGGAGWRWNDLERQARVREASARATEALQAATRLRGLAQGARVGDLGPWEQAAAESEKALALLNSDVEPELHQQVKTLADDVARDRQQAEALARAADRDQRLLDRLVDIRSALADDRDGWRTDAEYAEAFREAGIDLAAPDEAAKRIRERPPEQASALANAVDDWAAVRRDRKKDGAARRRFPNIAGAADPDPWRLGLRRALDVPDRAARHEALRRLARAAP